MAVLLIVEVLLLQSLQGQLLQDRLALSGPPKIAAYYRFRPHSSSFLSSFIDPMN